MAANRCTWLSLQLRVAACDAGQLARLNALLCTAVIQQQLHCLQLLHHNWMLEKDCACVVQLQNLPGWYHGTLFTV